MTQITTLVFSAALFSVAHAAWRGVPVVVEQVSCESTELNGQPLQWLSVDDAVALHTQDQATFIDARSHEDYELSHIEGAIHIDASTGVIDTSQLPKLSSSTKLIVYDDSQEACNMSLVVADQLQQEGFLDVHVLKEGMSGWGDKKHPLQEGE